MRRTTRGGTERAGSGDPGIAGLVECASGRTRPRAEHATRARPRRRNRAGWCRDGSDGWISRPGDDARRRRDSTRRGRSARDDARARRRRNARNTGNTGDASSGRRNARARGWRNAGRAPPRRRRSEARSRVRGGMIRA